MCSFNINSMCLANDTLKRSDIQEKKNALNAGYHWKDFDAPFTSHDC